MDKQEQTIKVLHVVSGLVSGGVEQMLINYYSHIDKDQFHFDIVYQHEPVEVCLKKFKERGCNTYRIPSKVKHPIKNFIETYHIIKENNYDIVHAHMMLTNFIPLLCAKCCGVKIRISHSHSNRRHSGILANIFLGICKSLTKRFATDFFACGEGAALYLYGKKTVDSNRVVIIHNAIDIKKFCYDENIRENERKRLGVENKYVIGHIGKFSEEKNHNFLIDIFNEVYRQNSNAVLVLVGTGKLKDNIKNKVHRLGLDDAVTFIDAQSDTSVLYQAFDVFVFPSLYEGLGMVAIEAQASGLNCILSDSIPLEVKITDLVEFISLSREAKYWADRILQDGNNYERQDTSSDIRQSGYDIEKNAQELSQWYFQRVQAQKYQ